MSTVRRIQNAIWRIEGFEVRIIYEDGRDVRDDRADLPIHWYHRAAKGDMTVAAWIASRFRTQYPGFSAKVLDGAGRYVHGRTQLATVRSSYH